MKNNKLIGVIISYIIGMPIGLTTVFIIFSIPVILTGEGLATIALVGAYGKPIIGLLISFIVALGIGGYSASIDIENQKTLIKASFKYSLTINSIIWFVFISLTIFNHEKNDTLFLVIPPIIAFVFCTIITTFTIGLMICYLIKKRLLSK